MELFFNSPLFLVYMFLLGVIVGSFINVFMYRFHTGRSLNGSSHCLSCQIQLRWFELVPLLSYVSVRGRCRNCGSYIPFRYPLVELLSGLTFLLAASHFDQLLWQLGAAVFLSILLCIVVYDLYHTIIPDEFTIALGAFAMVSVVVESVYTHSWAGAFFAVLAAIAAAGPFVFLWVISKGQWIGLGDAKLALPLGALVGIGSVFSFVVLSFWIGAVLSVALLSVQYVLRGQIGLRFLGQPLTMKSEVPFAPFLIISFLLTYFAEVDVLYMLRYVF